MDKDDIIKQITEKFNEINPKYWSVLLKKMEDPTNKEIIKIYNYLNSNIKYLQRYLSLLKITDEEQLKQEIEKNNFLKEIDDALYEPTDKKQFQNHPRIQEYTE
jgi:hypothetical protein